MSATLQVIMLLTLVGGIVGQANNTDEEYRQAFASILSQLEGGLELHLRDSRDAELEIVQLVMSQARNSLQISVQNEELPAMRHHLYLFEDVNQLQRAGNILINADGFYFLALENQLPEDEQLLKEFMAKIWLQHGHSRIYYIELSRRRILLYNPFQQSIVVVKDPKAYARIYQNLNGYPLRIYIFDSVYSSVIGDGESKKVLSVAGADAKLAKIVAKQLNFTPDYLWPDDEFFG